ncbi:MAG: M56 family metallopeptidase [Acidobacteria bacterium]|nr:M56 family metallopeptidase [Acidobacteriota bacterium]
MILMLSLATKATLVLVAVMVASWALRGSSASTRHALWALALSSLLALPVLSATLPRLGLPLLPLAEPEPSHALRLSPLESGRGAFDAASEAPPVRRWWDRALLVWLAGVSLGLIQLAASIVFASIVVRRARRVTSPEWSALLRETAAVMGVGRRVGLRVSGAVGVPIVWGYRSPVVLLAPEAMDWSDGRRRAVLLHELAHVARRDCLTQTLAYAVRTLYWPHPLVWWAVASLRREGERACDDRVLHAGMPASTYARHLLDAARDLVRPERRFLTASASAERTRLGDRVVALLDDHLDRRPPTRRANALLGAATLLAITVLAAAEPVAATSAQDSPPSQAPSDAELSDWIVHEPFGCLIESRFTEIDATIDPASEVEEARLYFAAAGPEGDAAYWVKMTREGSRFLGRLPKPRAEASPVRYRIEAHRRDGRIARTDHHRAVVVMDESQCPAGVRIAPPAESRQPVIVHGPAGAPREPPPPDSRDH